MTEAYIHKIIPGRLKQLGFTNYHEVYRDFMIEAASYIRIPAYNELYFIVDDPPGLLIESDYGMYDTTENPLPENIHQHRGEITIHNPGPDKRRIKFIQVIIVN